MSMISSSSLIYTLSVIIVIIVSLYIPHKCFYHLVTTFLLWTLKLDPCAEHHMLPHPTNRWSFCGFPDWDWKFYGDQNGVFRATSFHAAPAE